MPRKVTLADDADATLSRMPANGPYGTGSNGLNVSGQNYGIYDSGGLNYFAGNVGIAQTNPQYTLDVNGTARFSNLTQATGVGTVCMDSGYPISWTASNNCLPSDRRFKERVEPLAPALDLIDKLKPVTFYWNELSHNPDKRRRIGFIAQEVEPLIPEVVNTDSKGIKSISYDYLAAPIVKAIQELKADNDSLRATNDSRLRELKADNDNEAAQIKDLSARLDALEAARH
jgi:endosialidase-like protein